MSVRYRVEVADRPDAQYAVRGGQVFHAERSTTDGTMLLSALPGTEAPEDFDTEWNGSPAKVVPEADVTSTFAIHTLACYDDEYYRLAQQPAADELMLRWTGKDEMIATQLGLVDGTVTIDDVEHLSAVWQERHDRPGGQRAEPGTGDSGRLLRAIGRTLLGFLPQGWQRVAAQFGQVGDYSELEVRAVGGDDEGPLVVSLSSPAQLGQLFTELRSAMYEKGKGTWLQGTFTLDTDSNFDFDFDNSAEPNWRLGPGAGGRTTARGHDAELEYFPRDRENTPGWLAAKAGLPVEVAFRHPRVVDAHNEGEPPVVNRTPLPQDEIRALLSYLYRAPVVLSRQVPRPDIFAPAGSPDVPDAFHTDGSWVWPAAVPHYLRKYGLPPDPEFLEHIRAAGHRLPYVDKQVREAAQADLDGTPAPAQAPTDRHGLPDEIDRGADPAKTPRGSEVLTVLARRLTEHGVAESAYRIGERADGAWCLRKTTQGWEVARHAEGTPVDPRYFDSVEPAARCLLGTLLLYPGRAVAADAEVAEPTDWPIVPLRGEPPLTFLHGKRMTVLPEGTVLLRYGNEGGNLVHAGDTDFAETSLTLDREHEQHSYRVLRPLRVLTGVAVAWHGLPGGALTHLLPRAVGQHVETGALERA